MLWLHLLLDNLKYFNILVRGHSSAHPSGFLSEGNLCVRLHFAYRISFLICLSLCSCFGD